MVRTLLVDVGTFASRGFVLFVLAAAVYGWYQPSDFLWVGPWLTIMLGALMFGAGSTLSLNDLREILKRAAQVGAGVCLQYSLMPLFAYLLVSVANLPPEIGLGVILVGACPGGVLSNVITFIARGNLALSVAIISPSMLLSPVLTPIAILLLAGTDIEVSALQLFSAILSIIVVPLGLGIAAHLLFGANFSQVMRSVLPVFSVAIIMSLSAFVVGSNRETLAAASFVIILVTCAHNFAGLAAGYGAAKFMGLSKRQQKTYCFEVGMQNSGLAIALATIYFTPAAAIPAVISSICHSLSGPALASYWAWRDRSSAGST